MAVSLDERQRLRFLFGIFAVVPLFLCGWFFWIQVLQQGTLRQPGGGRAPLSARAAASQHSRSEALPSARGAILDRHGGILAMDCEAYEVRAEVVLSRRARASVAALRERCTALARGLADALSRDPSLADRAAARAAHFDRLSERLERAFLIHGLAADAALPAELPRRREILVDRGVCALPAIEALLALDERDDAALLHLQHTHERVYPEREVTYGLVGYLEDREVRSADGVLLAYEPTAVAGLESVADLGAGAPGLREFLVDSQHRRFFSGNAARPAAPSRVEATVDLELQKAASRELEREMRGLQEQGRKLPLWGGLVLVEVETGDVLAAASWHREAKSPRGAAFAPSQLCYEPGSIVKPLVLAYAKERCGLDWERVHDCSSTGADHHADVPEAHGRRVRDDHPVGRLSAHGILVNSSNIGAVKIGSLLEREDWRRYLDLFGFGASLDLPLPNERRGGPSPIGWREGISPQSFRKWTGSSYSIGYELQVNALQMARAYLTLLSGGQRALRLVRAVEVDGQRCENVVAPGRRELSAATIEAVTSALTDVVSDAEGATGRHIAAQFRKNGVELHGLIAGKTGTAKSRTTVAGKGTVEVRNASFVGFLPASRPRYLAVCVLQRDDSARFYGGSYAAPPAARLLLEAMRLDAWRGLGQEPQVSATPGSSGRGLVASETGLVGR